MSKKPKPPVEERKIIDLNVRITESMKEALDRAARKIRDERPWLTYTTADFVRETLAEKLQQKT